MRVLTFAALLSSQLSLVAAQAKPIGDLFIIDQKSCANYLANQANGVSKLQQNANEAAAMVESASRILVSGLANQDEIAEAYIDGLFAGDLDDIEVRDTMRSEC